MRAEKLIAKIHPENARSLKTFERCGFLLDSDLLPLKSFAMTLERYLRLLRESPADPAAKIYITEVDKARLGSLLASEQASATFELEHEVERAIVVNPRQVAPDVVTMNSRALLQLNEEKVEVALVYPKDLDGSADKRSICADIGTAILGCQAGDAFDWRLTDRTCRIWIEKVLYQPEASGDFHL
jgi:regulator of nucleoside diphosphate kinase